MCSFSSWIFDLGSCGHNGLYSFCISYVLRWSELPFPDHRIIGWSGLEGTLRIIRFLPLLKHSLWFCIRWLKLLITVGFLLLDSSTSESLWWTLPERGGYSLALFFNQVSWQFCWDISTEKVGWFLPRPRGKGNENFVCFYNLKMFNLQMVWKMFEKAVANAWLNSSVTMY